MGYEKEEDYIYSAASIKNSRYEKLFDEIKQCGERSWNVDENVKAERDLTTIIKHPDYSDYSVLDFNHLYKFLTKLVKSRKKSMNSLLSSMDTPFARGGTFRQGMYRAVEPHQIEHGICTAAKFLKIPLISLLAQFLKDCESNKKIRLLLHSEYEKTIKDFVREAPDLVAKLQSKSSQPFTQNDQEQSPIKLPEKTITKSNIPLRDPPYILKSVKKGNNEHEIDLNPYNLNSIPLFGRKKQLGMLNDFLKPKQTLFSTMAIVAPSGAGKTRLVTEWFVENFIKNTDAPQWQAGFINSSDITPWQKWTPTCNTLIIADYIYRYDAVINEIIQKGEKSKQHHIRLLVLDHVLDGELSNLIDDPHGRRAHGPDKSDLKSRERFVHPTLYLEKVNNRMDILQDIIANVSGKHKDSDEVKKALALIQTMGEEDKVASKNTGSSEQTPKDNEPGKQAAAHPLFAALIGQALKDPEQPITHWKRQDLIDYYLRTSNRQPWAKQKDGQKADVDGEWVGVFVAAATIRRGMSFDALRNCLPKGKEYTDDEFDRIKSWCWRIVSSVDDEWLKPFVPDILGENFFLLFFRNFKSKSPVRKAFIRMLCAKENNQANEDSSSDDIAKKYMDFVQHLTRNLSNEEQKSSHVQKAWKTLAAFLNPKLYPKTSPLRLTVSFAIMAVSDILEENGLSYLNTPFLSKVNVDDLVAASEGNTCIDAMDVFTKYFDRCNEMQRKQSGLQDKLNTIYQNFEAQSKDKSNRLMAAIQLGCLNTVKFIISQHSTDINATNHQGMTALMYACRDGHETVAALLLKDGAKEKIEKSNRYGMTALIFAVRYGNEAVVALLLNEGANKESNWLGKTMLMYASAAGHKAVVALLLNEGAKEKINESDRDNDMTALMYACRNGHKPVAALLLNEGAKKMINKSDRHDMTALMYACKNGHEAIVALLLNEGAKKMINERNKFGITALMLASEYGHEAVSTLLLKEGAKEKINESDEHDMTALMYACKNGHEAIVALLLREGAKEKINEGDWCDMTALMYACRNGHGAVAALLLKEGAKEKINGRDWSDMTALMYAKNYGHEVVAALLIKAGAIQ